MNQVLADMFLAMPRTLTEPRVFGSVYLVLIWLGYLFFIRTYIRRVVIDRCDANTVVALMRHPTRRLLYSSVRKQARLDEGGLYAINLGSLIGLIVVTVVHALLFWLAVEGYSVAETADRVLLTVVVGVFFVLFVVMQPVATIARRLRWGFTRPNAVVHAVIWDVLIVVLMYLWLYDAWFLPVFL